MGVEGLDGPPPSFIISDSGTEDERHGACGRLARGGVFLAVRRRFEAGDANPEHGTRTLVFGAARGVRAVTVSSAKQLWRARLSRRGRSFIAVLPGGLTARDLTISLGYRNGRSKTFIGRREVNLVRPTDGRRAFR